jgi:ribosomal protein S12 methylthiotransferase accessory factor
VIAMPQCPVCGGAAAAGPTLPNASRQPGRELPPDALLEQLSGWVDPRTGIVARLVLQPVQSSARGLPFVVTASPPHIVGVDGAIRRLPIGWGKGLDAATAVASAVGEAIERYAASLPDPSRIVWRRPDELDGDRLDPRAFALYADDQYASAGFPYVRFDPSIRHPWVRGTWLGSRSRVWVPAVLAFLALDLEPRQHFGQGTSNGLAASTDFDQAAVRATLEIVERDAFLATWFSGHAGRRIGVDDSIDPRLRDVLDGLSAMGAAVEIYQLDTSACGVTVLCLGLGDGDRWPGITLGLGADVDPRVAVRQAVLELGQTGPHLLHLMRAGQPPVPADAASVREMIDHAAYYFPPSRAAAFDALRGNGPPTALRDLTTPAVARTPAGLAAALASAGVRVAIVDVTSADVATGPFRVARAVSPDLQPLSYGSGYDRPMVARVRGLHRRGYTPAIHPIW